MLQGEERRVEEVFELIIWYLWCEEYDWGGRHTQ